MNPRSCLLCLPLALAACSEQYVPGVLYQATTPGCTNWADGSRFELPKQISVFAGRPNAVGDAGVELSLAYFIPRDVEARFKSQEFAITLPRGASVSRGTVALVERAGSPVRAETTVVLPGLPDSLRGESPADETMYRVKIQFTGPLPERFDFTPPDMLLGEKSYPVRTYTYRLFTERNAYGLCT